MRFLLPGLLYILTLNSYAQTGVFAEIGDITSILPSEDSRLQVELGAHVETDKKHSWEFTLTYTGVYTSTELDLDTSMGVPPAQYVPSNSRWYWKKSKTHKLDFSFRFFPEFLSSRLFQLGFEQRFSSRIYTHTKGELYYVKPTVDLGPYYRAYQYKGSILPETATSSAIGRIYMLSNDSHRLYFQARLGVKHYFFENADLEMAAQLGYRFMIGAI